MAAFRGTSCFVMIAAWFLVLGITHTKSKVKERRKSRGTNVWVVFIAPDWLRSAIVTDISVVVTHYWPSVFLVMYLPAPLQNWTTKPWPLFFSFTLAIHQLEQSPNARSNATHYGYGTLQFQITTVEPREEPLFLVYQTNMHSLALS